MNPYMKQLETHLAQYILEGNDVESVWEMLYWCYTECYPINNEEIRKGFRDLESCLPRLTLEQDDKVTNLISILCLEHEKAAFYAGLQAGTRLVLELEG